MTLRVLALLILCAVRDAAAQGAGVPPVQAEASTYLAYPF